MGGVGVRVQGLGFIKGLGFGFAGEGGGEGVVSLGCHGVMDWTMFAWWWDGLCGIDT